MTKKYLIYSVIILAIVLGVFYFLNQSQDSPTQINTEQVPVAQTPSMNGPVTLPTTVGPSESAPGTKTEKSHNVSIANFSFTPAILEVNKGDTVVWTNSDSAPHQIAGIDTNSTIINKEESYSFVFNDSGTFDYYCKLHPSMKGSVVVK